MPGRKLLAALNRVLALTISVSTLLMAPGLPGSLPAQAAPAPVPAAQPETRAASQAARAPQAVGAARPFSASVPTPDGVGNYLAAANQGTNLNLPIVRADGSFDTVIHVANATAAATSATIVLYDVNGNTVQTVTRSLAGNASSDYDIGQDSQVPSGFVGTATISAGTAISAAADIYQGSSSNDNFDSYSAVADPSTSQEFPLAINDVGYTSNIYVQNPNQVPANVQLQFRQGGNPVGSTGTTGPFSAQIPAFGSISVAAASNGISNGFGPVQITSDQPVVVGGDLSGNNAYAAVALPNVSTQSSYLIPEFDYSTDPNGWNTAITVLNNTSSPTDFTVVMYNPDGSVAGQMDSGQIGAGKMWMIGLVEPVPPTLTSGFSGPAVITSSAGAAVPIVVQAQGPSLAYNGLAAYIPPAAPPSTSPLVVPSIRNNVAGESTALTLFNATNSSQSYQIQFFDQNGSQVEATSVCLLPNTSWTVSQATDANLPAGFTGSAQITNATGGALPIALAAVYAGNFQPPYVSSGASGSCPTPTATSTATPLVSSTPTQTPIFSYTPTSTASTTLTPTKTNTPIPQPLLGASSYIGGTDQNQNFVLPLVRSDHGYDTVVHVANANAGQTTIQMTFYNADGSTSAVVQKQIPTWGLFDYDVQSQLPNFNGSVTVSASQGIALATDVISTTTGGIGFQPFDALDTYAGVSAGATDAFVGTLKAYFLLNSNLYVENPTGQTANVTLSFQTTPITQMSLTLPPFGSAEVPVGNVAGVPTNWIGTVEIQSNVPVTTLSEVYGHQDYSLATMSTPGNNPTFLVPQFWNGGPGGWGSGVVLQNTGPVSSTYSATFYNPDGTVNTHQSLTLNPGEVKTLSTLVSTIYLPTGYEGPVRVTTQGTGVSLVVNILASLQFLGLTSYTPQIQGISGAAQTGNWAYLPAIRKNFLTNGNIQSTTFSLFNSQTTAQSYSLTYWTSTGGVAEHSTISIPPLGSVYLDQALDTSLPDGFEGSVQVTNTTSGGPLPVSVINTYQGVSIAPPPATATPLPTSTPTATNTATITPTPGAGTPSVTPTLTPSPTASPTFTGTATNTPTQVAVDRYEPDEKPAEAKPLPLDGSVQFRTFGALGDQDWVTIQVNAGDTIKVSSTVNVCDAQIWLYDISTTTGQANVLAMDDDSGPGFAATLVYTFKRSGTYFLQLRHYVTQSTNAQWSLPYNLGTCAYQLAGSVIQSSSPTPTATGTLTPVGSETPTPTETEQSTIPQTPTATGTQETIPVTPTATETQETIPASPTATETQESTIPRTATPTSTQETVAQPTSTATQETIGPSPTPSATQETVEQPTGTATATETAVPTSTSSSTPEATETATNTAVATDTATVTSTATATSSNTATDTATATETSVPSATATASSTATFTPENTETLTPEPSETPTATSTPSTTPTLSSTPVFSGTATPTATITSTAVTSCVLMPIALSQITLNNAVVGQSLNNVLNGTTPGNFGWLTWAEDPSASALATSLTLPGNSSTYVDPFNSSNRSIVLGGFIRGAPGVKNSSQVNNALLALINSHQAIDVPVWDTTILQGSNTDYHIVGFAQITLTNFSLGQTNTISAVLDSSSRPCSNVPTPTITPTIAPTSASLFFPANSTSSQTVSINGGQIQLSIPPNVLGNSSVDQTLQLNINQTTLPPGTNLHGGVPLTVLSINLTDNGKDETGVTFTQPIVITESYDPAQIAEEGVNPNQLRIYIVNPTTLQVQALPSTVDTVAHTVSASIPHLTFVVLGNGAADTSSWIYLPIALNNANVAGW
jgi:hypothetical protein